MSESVVIVGAGITGLCTGLALAAGDNRCFIRFNNQPLGCDRNQWMTQLHHG